MLQSLFNLDKTSGSRGSESAMSSSLAALENPAKKSVTFQRNDLYYQTGSDNELEVL